MKEIQNQFKILIIEDDELFTLTLTHHLTPYGIIYKTKNLKEALEYIEKDEIDLCLIDLWLEGELAGPKILNKAHEKKILSYMLSSSEDQSLIEHCLKSGATDFLDKKNFKKQIVPIFNFLQKSKKKQDHFSKHHFLSMNKNFIFEAEQAIELFQSGSNLFLTGETGVGKTYFAKMIHQESSIKNAPFIHLNCAEIPENLIESELFGHKKGAFTDAKEDHIGKIEMAHQGTLFLDEIATLPPKLQTKLLKVLEDKEFYAIGSNKKIKVNFKLISATCENIEELLSSQKLRKDLFFRIAHHQWHLPSLKERKEDIPILIKKFATDAGKKLILDPKASEFLIQYSWPGNIRELQFTIEKLMHRTRGIIKEKDVQFLIKKEQCQLTHHQNELLENYGLNGLIKKLEQDVALKVFKEENEKIRPTLKRLKISSTTLYRILKEAQYEL
jgi:two-component system response regulator AtoC